MATQLPHSPSLPHSVCATPLHQDGYSPLNWTSYKGHRDCADLLLIYNADPNHPDKVTRGEVWEVTPTPHPPPPARAAHTFTHSWSMQPPCIQNGDTPLALASMKGHRDCAALLLGHFAKVGQQNEVTWGEGWEVAPVVVGADACII